MSFGFGFALPAYPLRGGGGNNPFNQDGATLDLSFIGTAGDLSGADTYTLNTDFITPEYQVAAQYAVWENGVGLAQKTFSQIVTFSRSSGATWFNSAGILQGVDFSVTSNTIGTGSKTFTLDATAGVNRYWTAGDTVLISDQANSANNMVGTVTSYNASTQVLVCDITSTGGSGTLTAWRIGSTMPRFDYNPSTLAAQGLLIEEARTNSIRNNTMVGAVAGTPGTNPTNWGNSTGGLTKTIVGIGTANGIAYVDFRFNGTTSSTFLAITTDVTNVIAASNGQVWTSSAWLSVVGGSTVNLNEIQLQLGQYSSVPTFLSNLNGSNIVSSLTSTSTRFSSTLTTNNASVAFLQPVIVFGFASGVAIDITLRIGLPQLELGAFATSVIPTTTTALTRSADVASVNTLSPWYNAAAGTLFAEYITSLTANAVPASFNDATGANRVTIINASIFTSARNTGGAGVVFTPSTVNAPSTTGVNKVALAFANLDYAISGNGGAVGTASTYNVPTVTRLEIGQQLTATVLNGYLRRITYYPRRLSNAELQTTTT